MRTDGGRVEDQQVEVGVAEGSQDRVPSPGLGPAVEAAPGAVPGPEPLREVAPGDAGAGDVQHGVDKEPVVPGGAAMLPGPAGQEVLDPVPDGVGDRVAGSHGWPSVA